MRTDCYAQTEWRRREAELRADVRNVCRATLMRIGTSLRSRREPYRLLHGHEGRREIELAGGTADQPRSARRLILRRNLLLILFVALVALSPTLAGCYHDDTADEPTPTGTGGDGGNGDGGGY